MSSIFSKIIAGEIPSYKIAEDDKFFAFLDINPTTKGHTLVIPKIEVDYIFDLEDSLLTEMILFSKKVAAAIKKAIPCNRVGLMIVGLDVPHAHIHLMPIDKASDMDTSKAKVELSNKQFEEIAKTISEKMIY